MAFSGRGGVAGWGRLVVFASGKNRAIAGRPLHSNFNLNAKGEYLALFPPTGNTPTTAFAPSYPARRPDVSFGTGLREIAALRVEDSRASRPSLPLPPANDVDCNGIQEPFDDPGWLPATAAVGYDDLSEDLGWRYRNAALGLHRQLRHSKKFPTATQAARGLLIPNGLATIPTAQGCRSAHHSEHCRGTLAPHPNLTSILGYGALGRDPTWPKNLQDAWGLGGCHYQCARILRPISTTGVDFAGRPETPFPARSHLGTDG